MSNFRVGQEVACITDDAWVSVSTGKFSTGPKKGDVHAVTGIITCAGGTFLQFSEYHGDAFCSSNFRPVVKTDISVFTAMLAPAPRQKEVEHV